VSGLKPVAVQVGLVDRPSGRKQHQGDIPLVGGLAMFGGFSIVAISLFPAIGYLPAMLFGATVLVVTGLVDDHRELSPGARFIAQSVAVLAMIFGGDVVVRDLGDLVFIGTLALGYGAVAFTVFGVVGVINAVNMTDGLDGLAGSLALVMVLALAAVAWDAGLEAELDLLLTLAFTILGFLAFNARTPWQSRARVFMGDAGSMLLGFLLAWFFVHLSQGPARAMAPVTALWIFALPLLDTLTVMARRLLNGSSPFKSDREHLHHILQRAGFSVTQTVAIMTGLAASLAAIGIMGHRVVGLSDGAMFVGLAAVALAYVVSVNRVRRVGAPDRSAS
jgi:UDP-GlcNAc:undecaprenyl-phosphate GlcNAc-1-phosphate transferase